MALTGLFSRLSSLIVEPIKTLAMKNYTLSYALKGRPKSYGFYLILLLVLFSMNVVAQHIQFNPYVQPTNGGSVRRGNFVVDWTLGQPAQAVLQNGNLIVTQGFEQPEKPLPPIAPAPQSACSDTSHTFVFTNVLAGAGGDQVEWSLHSNFDTTHIINSGDSIRIIIASGFTDTIWLKSRFSGNGFTSESIWTAATVDSFPHNVTPFIKKDTVCPHTFGTVYIPASQTNVRYDLLSDTVVLSTGIGNNDTLSLSTNSIDSTTFVFLKATDILTGCFISLNPGFTFQVAKYASIPSFYLGDSTYYSSLDTCYEVSVATAKSIRYSILNGHATINQNTGCVSKVDSSFIVQVVAIGQCDCNITSSYLQVSVNSDSISHNQSARLGERNLDQMWHPLGPIPDDNYSFEDGNSYGAGRVYCFAFSKKAGSPAIDPYVYYAGSPLGGLWKSDNSGNLWEDLSDGLQQATPICSISDIAINPDVASNTPTIYVSTGFPETAPNWGSGLVGGRAPSSTGVYVSKNGGITFEPTDLLFDINEPHYISRLVLNKDNPQSGGNDQLFAATSEGLYISNTSGKAPTGGGTGWQIIDANNTFFTVEVSPNNSKGIYASGNEIDFFDVTNLPATKTILPLPTDLSIVPSGKRQILVKVKKEAGSSNDQIYIYAFYDDGTWHSRTYWASWNRGASSITWNQLSNPGDAAFNLPATECSSGTPSYGSVDLFRGKMAINPNASKTEILQGNCVGRKGTAASAAGTWSWSHLSSSLFATGATNDIHTDYHAFEYIPGTEDANGAMDALIGTDGGVFKIDKAGAKTELNKGLNLRLVLDMSGAETDPDRITVGAYDCGSDNKFGGEWDRKCTGDGATGQLYDYSGGDYFFTSCGAGSSIEDRANLSSSLTSYTSNFSPCTFGAAKLQQDPDDPDIFYQISDGLYENTRDISIPTNVNWAKRRLVSLAELKGALTLDLNAEIIYSFAVTPTVNGQKYCYMATHNRWMSYLLLNRNFSSISSTNCGFTGTTDWEVVTLPSNDAQYIATSGWEAGHRSYFSINGIAVNDRDPNQVWVCYSHEEHSGFTVERGSYDAINNNWNWLADDAGLPADIQCTTIVYENGSNNGLYLGTTRGVYYKNDGLASWIPYQASLPYVEVKALEINYCSGQIRAGTFGRGIYTAPLYQDFDNTKAHALEGDETWSSRRDVAADIIIPDGITLTISGSATKINMAKGTNIIVKTGGKLLVEDGATVSNLCDKWDGIIVEGDKTQSQDLSSTNNTTARSSHQGFVYLEDATIENAYEAIRLWNPNDGWVSQSTTDNIGGSGGIVRAVNTHFLNNRRSAEFMWYHHISSGVEVPNKSFFTNCIFETDNNYTPGEPVYSHVSAWGVNGIKFRGCQFVNSRTDITGSTNDYELGDGIRTIDAGFIVYDYTSSIIADNNDIQRSVFKNLNHGVYIENTISHYTVRVQHANFLNCARGIRNEGQNLCSFIGNNFVVGSVVNKTDNGSGSLVNEGITLHQCTGFRVEQDTFTSNPDVNFWTLGIRADETGGNNNVIYKNTFTGLVAANVANRQNQYKLLNSVKGLQYVCNQNASNAINDIASLDDQGNPQAGISSRQGSVTLSAGNTFSHTNGLVLASDYGDWTNPLHYYQTGLLNNLSNPLDPYYKTSNVSVHNARRANACLSNYSTPTSADPTSACIRCLTKADYITAFSGFKTRETSFNADYIALIDGGSTSARLAQVDSATDSGTLKLQLDTYAPNLSSTVLHAVVLKNSLLNDTVQYQILKANPEGITSAIIADWIKWVHPGEEMLDTLQQIRDSLTLRTFLLDTLIYSSTQKELALNEILRQVVEDTLGFDVAAYRGWLDSSATLWSACETINTYLNEGRFDTVESLIANGDTLIARNDSIAFRFYKDYALAYKDWMASDSSIMRLDSANISAIKVVAGTNEHRKSAQLARSVLNFFYDSSYFTPPLLPEIEFGKRGNEDWKSSEDAKLVPVKFLIAPTLKLYPNPAQDVFIVEYTGVAENSKLFIVSMTGEIVETRMAGGAGKIEVNTTAYQNGVYLARIESDGNSLLKGKFLVLK
jgi:hypothetical protein